ncbi:MAG TPA: nucleotidyltransferase family protein [Acidisarcina sp.]|nr:nucleotidyltransferase family protein [Acidisarcina sp.]
MTDCASILLAAGGSSRLGKPKQLLQVDGESLLRRTARFAVEAGCSPNIVVLGSSAATLRRELDGLPVEILINPDWRTGKGSSLRVAMRSLLQRSPVPAAALFLVCDQPRISVELLRTLLAKQSMEGGSIVASRYAGVGGVPAVFPSAFFPELAFVQGDQGARQILPQHAVETSYVDFPQGEFDVDTHADELALKQTAKKS